MHHEKASTRQEADDVIQRYPSVRHAARRPIVLAMTAGAAAALLLSGCAAGDHAATSKEVPVVDGGSAIAGSIRLNDASIIAPKNNSYAKGADAHLQMYLTNSGQTDDELIKIGRAHV